MQRSVPVKSPSSQLDLTLTPTYYISSIAVKKLWGHRDIPPLSLHPDINIIIGPNASGKTTIINLLYSSLIANLIALSQIEFQEILISLAAFESTETSTVRVVQSKESIDLTFGKLKASLPIGEGAGSWHSHELHGFLIGGTLRKRFPTELFVCREQLALQVPAVWLPVSRRLPIAEEEAERRRLHRKPLESVDECLSDLLEGLQKYRVSLDSHLSELRKEFQKHALETILYDKQHDNMPNPRSLSPPSQEEKEQLLQAFTDVGFSDSRIKKRINDHFAAAEEATRNLLTNEGHIDHLNTLFTFPLINRTKSMVRFAQELERKRTELFAPLHLYESVVNSFLTTKFINVSEKGEITITTRDNGRQKKDALAWRHLSSGEKQILILLTQALLWEHEPVVYVADEPELSLHVTWQEKLMASLVQLAGRCQFIVATHSPDIAGGFPRNIIDLGRV